MTATAPIGELYRYERALRRRGLGPVAGVDEAGRGACAGPLVAAAVILQPGRAGQIPGLDDSKRLSARQRDLAYDLVTSRAAAWAAVVIDPGECDRLGMHRANIEALRRAVARLAIRPSFVLSDGFAVDGLATPGLGVWKGDQVAACVAAASVVAKVTRDRLMVELHSHLPQYRFDVHKGYCTGLHQGLLIEHGPSEHHRWCFDNVRRAAQEYSGRG